MIGKGSFGKVMQVRKKDTQRVYALKTIRKANIASRPGEITHILAERTVLALVNNPFIVPLKFSFQNPDKLYLVMSFGESPVRRARLRLSVFWALMVDAVNGGELFYHLQREGKFDEYRSRFYAAELLCALEHLHMFNVVYRCVPSQPASISLPSLPCPRPRPRPSPVLVLVPVPVPVLTLSDCI